MSEITGVDTHTPSNKFSMACLFFIMCVKLSDVLSFVWFLFFPKLWTFLNHVNKKYCFIYIDEMLAELPLYA